MNRIKMIYKGDWTIGNYPHIPKQMLNSSYMHARIKIIAPSNRAICFQFHSLGNKTFGYVRSYDSDRLPKLCTFINKQELFKTDVFNYLPQRGIFKKFIALAEYILHYEFNIIKINYYFFQFHHYLLLLHHR
jgi:hypothetical protein